MISRVAVIGVHVMQVTHNRFMPAVVIRAAETLSFTGLCRTVAGAYAPALLASYA